MSCIVFTAFTLHQYAKLIHHLLKIDYNWQFELAIVSGMLCFQFPFIIKQQCIMKLEYYSNMLLVSLFGSLLLWPLLFANNYWPISDTINIMYFFAIIFFMFFEHKRRVARLNLPGFISYTWVLYRFIILLFIV